MQDETLGIKKIEKILSREISDWIRWGRNKDYLPPSFRCTLGFLYLPMRGDLEVRLYKPVPVNLLEVIEFEKIVISLPVKHRQAFVMYHLDRALVNGRIVQRKRSYKDNAKLLGVHQTRYYVLLAQAHNMIFRKWKDLQDLKQEKYFQTSGKIG
jgi:hypothetical protein